MYQLWMLGLQAASGPAMVLDVNAPRFIPGHESPARDRQEALLFAAQGLELLVQEHEGALSIPKGSAFPELIHTGHFIGTLDGTDCYAVTYPKGQGLPVGVQLVPARALFRKVDEVLLMVAGRALAIAEWDTTHRFCGRDGAPTELMPGERARRCPTCRTPFYPRIPPAIIVLVTRGDRMLLARSANFPEPMFSTLAGFVEPGESLEETVVREVKEEVGVDVANVRYFGSQPWPFGRSLMVGFTAEYAGGELHVDGKEIAEAAWFPVDSLPRIPPRLSIARHLIDSFVARVKANASPPGSS